MWARIPVATATVELTSCPSPGVTGPGSGEDGCGVITAGWSRAHEARPRPGVLSGILSWGATLSHDTVSMVLRGEDQAPSGNNVSVKVTRNSSFF